MWQADAQTLATVHAKGDREGASATQLLLAAMLLGSLWCIFWMHQFVSLKLSLSTTST